MSAILVPSDFVTKLCKDLGFGELKGSDTLSDNDNILDESGQRRHKQLLGRLLWLDRQDIKKTQFVNCPLTSAQPPLVLKSTSRVC